MNREEDRSFRAVVGAEDLYLAHLHACLALVLARRQQARARLATIMAGHEMVDLAGLLVQVVRVSEELTLLGRRAALELAQYLIVPLAAHDDLAVDVLDVHVLAAVPRVRPHQARLVRDAGLYVVDSGGRGRLLQRRGSDLAVRRLLDAVD